MDAEMKPNQLARLSPETVKAVKDYRRHIKRTTGDTVSINSALNEMIVLGWAFILEHQKIEVKA